jgi:hypothetical protein
VLDSNQRPWEQKSAQNRCGKQRDRLCSS